MPISPELQMHLEGRLSEDERKLVSPENLERTRQRIEAELQDKMNEMEIDQKLLADHMVDAITKSLGIPPSYLTDLRREKSRQSLEAQQDLQAQRFVGMDFANGPDRTVMSTHSMATWHGRPDLINIGGGYQPDLMYRPPREPSTCWIRTEHFGDFDPGPIIPNTIGSASRPVFVPAPGRTLREDEMAEIRRRFAEAMEEMKNQPIVHIPDKKVTKVEEPEEEGVAAPDFRARRKIEID